MNQFPSTPRPEDGPDMPIVTRIYEYLGCREPLSKAFISAALTAIRVFDWKQHSYGADNIAKKGVLGICVRTNDKIERLGVLLERGENPTEEGRIDTLGDIGVYGLIGLLVEWGLWPKYSKTKDETLAERAD